MWIPKNHFHQIKNLNLKFLLKIQNHHCYYNRHLHHQNFIYFIIIIKIPLIHHLLEYKHHLNPNISFGSLFN